MSYHGRMMNLQPDPDFQYSDAYGVDYRTGHRDARHAAAEIANEADVEIERLRWLIAEMLPFVKLCRTAYRAGPRSDIEATDALIAKATAAISNTPA
jgi:hypothetical protein